MASGEQQEKLGLIVAGEFHSADASLGLRVPAYEQKTNAPQTIGPAEYLSLSFAKVVATTAGDTALFFDQDDLASGEAIVAIVDGGGGEDTVNVAGDRAQEFEAGRPFVIANSTANDGAYISTGAVYDEVLDETTISVATGSWTDTTVDGDITSVAFRRAGSSITRGTFVASGGEVDVHDREILRRGRDGEGVYCVAAAGDVDAQFAGVIRKVLTKTFATGVPIADPT